MKKKLWVFLGVAAIIAFGAGKQADAATEGDTIEWKKMTIATYNAEGQMVYQPIHSARYDSSALEYLLENDKEKTLVIPSGTNLKVDQVIDIGDNTTLIATGATITQINNGVGVVKHIVDGANYNSIKNVTFIGGHWKTNKNTKGCTMFRFVHGTNLKFKNVSIDTNYQGHALELIGCKKVTVDGCKLIAKNNSTKSGSSREEALQIDIATPHTAPGVLKESGKKSYVNGQICQNITIQNSTVNGSRGICANFASQDSKYLGRFHRNITITNCKVTSTSSEAVALFNAVGCNVTGNTINTKSKSSQPYSDGLHMVLMRNNSVAKKYANVITGNKVKGKHFAIDITTNGGKYGKTTVKNNMVYSSSGKAHGVNVKSCTKASVGKNKFKKW